MMVREFCKRGHKYIGYDKKGNGICYECRKIWVNKNREKINFNRKEQYKKNRQIECESNKNRQNYKYHNDQIYRQELLKKQREAYHNNKEERQKRNRENWLKNKIKYNAKQRIRHPEYVKKLKTEVLTYYGNGILQCVCCKINQIEFLTLDHINGRDKEDRGNNKNKKAGVKLWVFVRKNNFPSGYQTLCWNCNCGRQINKGICPHQIKKEGIL